MSRPRGEFEANVCSELTNLLYLPVEHKNYTYLRRHRARDALGGLERYGYDNHAWGAREFQRPFEEYFVSLLSKSLYCSLNIFETGKKSPTNTYYSILLNYSR